jgi:predicted HTH transcriptional regulator
MTNIWRKKVSNAVKVLRLIKQKTNITAVDIDESIGISARAVEKIIDSLKTAGIIERKGSRKAGYWVFNCSE